MIGCEQELRYGLAWGYGWMTLLFHVVQHGMPLLFLYIFSSHCGALDGTAFLPYCYCYCGLLHGWVAAGQLQKGIKAFEQASISFRS